MNKTARPPYVRSKESLDNRPSVKHIDKQPIKMRDRQVLPVVPRHR